ncbi:MAG: type II toxin-antitoxin system VapC family toxin, partial [Nitrospirae bacterium]
GEPAWSALTRPLLSLVERGACAGVTSALAVTELLTGPLRQGDEGLATEYRRWLAAFPNLEVVPVGVEIAETAARLRARHGIRTPDALHLATALVAGADAFVTADTRLRRVREIEVLPLRP